MDGDTTFGAWLKSRRRQLVLTQKGLAYQAGCSVGSIRKMEADERRPSRQLAALLAQQLEIPPDQREVFIAFARSEAYISDTPLPFLPAAEDQIPIIPQETKIPRIKHNLPLETAPFVGREAELAALDELLLNPGIRLVTIVGPGGIGKTRLALALAERQLGDQAGSQTHSYKDGVFFVDLAPVVDAERLVFSLTEALDYRIQAGARENRSPKQQILDYLRDRQLLLVLDNFEQLLFPLHPSDKQVGPNGVDLVADILQNAPKVRILVTSRERLNLQEEQVFAIDGLTFPDRGSTAAVAGLDDAVSYTAIELFLQAAQRNQQDFNLETDDERLGLVQICQMVDGMPLALELASSWVDTLSIQDIAAEIQHGLDLLETELRDMPDRHRSMRATFDYSWRKLDEREQSIFTQLSIFRVGFTRQAAQAVTGATLRQLSRLVNKSFIQFDKHRNRYQVHELLRQYGAERLARDSELEGTVQDRHSSYYCQALVGWERDLQGARQAAAVHEMVLEIDNIRTAWKWAINNLGLKLLMEGINGLCIFFDRIHQRLEGEAICHSLVERLDGIIASNISGPCAQADAHSAHIDRLKLLARALAWDGYFNLRLGNLDRSHQLLQKCLSTLESGELVEQDTRFEKAFAYLFLSSVLRTKNVPAVETLQLAEEAVQLFRSLKEPWWVGFALHFALFNSGLIGSPQGEKYLDDLFTIQRYQGDLRGLADSLANGSYILANSFKFEKADAMLYEALAISKKLDDRHKVVSIYGTMGFLWVWQGRFEEARAMYHETLAAYNDLDYTQSVAFQIHVHLGYPDLYLGEYSMARCQAQHAIELLREAKNYYVGLWNAYCLDILGKAELAEGSFAEAEGYFQECQMVYRTYAHKEKISTNLACLGYIARAKNQIYQAQGYFFQALDIATKGNVITLAHSLPGIALLFADQGKGERAVELYTIASTLGMVANSRWFADIAGDEIAAVAAKLPAEVVDAAKRRARVPVSWEVAAELLVELEALGWNSAD